MARTSKKITKKASKKTSTRTPAAPSAIVTDYRTSGLGVTYPLVAEESVQQFLNRIVGSTAKLQVTMNGEPVDDGSVLVPNKARFALMATKHGGAF